MAFCFLVGFLTDHYEENEGTREEIRGPQWAIMVVLLGGGWSLEDVGEAGSVREKHASGPEDWPKLYQDPLMHRHQDWAFPGTSGALVS